MSDQIRTGDLVVARRQRSIDVDRLRRWGKKGLFDKAYASNVPLGWPADEKKIWLVIDDVCPEMYHFTHSAAVSEFLGIRFYKCRSAEGEIKIFPEFTIRKA